MPQSDLFAQGYVAMRLPEVQEALRRHGVAQELLEPFAASPGLLAALAQADSVQNTEGQTMDEDQVATFRQNALATSDAESAYQRENSQRDYQMVTASQVDVPSASGGQEPSAMDQEQNAAGWTQPR